MKMNKIIALAFIMMSSQAYALPAPQLLNITVSGSIPVTCNYSFGGFNSATTATTATASVTLTGLQETLGNITVTCNDGNGYVLNASSTNSGKLQMPATTGGISYSLSVDAGSAVPISPSGAIYTRLSGAGLETGATHALKINYASNPQAAGSAYPAGSYSDTIMLSMQAQ